MVHPIWNDLKLFVLIHSGWSIIDWVAYTQQKFISRNSGGWETKIKAPADLVSGEGSLLGSQTAVFLLHPHMEEGSKELSRVSFIRALISFTRVPLS